MAAAPLPPQAAAGPLKTIGIQVGAVSFVDEGVERVLDVFQQRASINTLFLAVFTYGRGIAGRQVPGQRSQITASRSTIRGRSTEATMPRRIRSTTEIQ